jgi:cellulose synthase/poly-beta-1,6-N-acetylglucosamine synthase-like glycosyltransferase
MSVVDIALCIVAVALLVPCTVFFLECLIGAFVRGVPSDGGDASTASGPPRPRIAVLVPAHNERAGITVTLQGLAPQLSNGDVLLVVADNCSDDTADVAQRAGATVIRRQDEARRGKGYALAFGLDHLAADPPDVVVIIDADCSVAPGAIERIARLAARADRPVQADYLLEPPNAAQGLTVVSALAFIVKNRVRPRGLHALGLPCLLTGTGMAFPWRVIRMAPPTEGNLVEDMVMGLDLARMGHAPLLCPEARVTSALPDRAQAAHSQRRRWEHGHLATLAEQGPRLLAASLRKLDVGLFALALDLMVPPLSLLVLGVGLAFASSALAGWLGASLTPALLMASALAMVTSGVLVAWLAHGRDTLRARQLLSIPLYVLWKLPLYFSFLTRGRHATWDRTERSADHPVE